jgi:NAD(P)-dependent dehydrogenase (short-subunit alcohol dehydrogenase family)
MTKTIIITGAGRGVGKSCAERFLKEGWSVGLIGRNPDPLSEMEKEHKNAMALPCDVADADAVDAAFDAFVGHFGRLDALFNNAGITLPGKPIDEVDVDDWRSLIDINLTGSFICARKAFGLMRHQDPQGGRIINNGSVSAYVPRVGSVAYTASKHAVTGLTRTISLDGRTFNIACGQIDIGNALTDMAYSMTQGMPQPDGSVRVEAVMDVDHVASSLLHMAELPLDTNVQFMTVMATTMPYIGRG